MNFHLHNERDGYFDCTAIVFIGIIFYYAMQDWGWKATWALHQPIHTLQFILASGRSRIETESWFQFKKQHNDDLTRDKGESRRRATSISYPENKNSKMGCRGFIQDWVWHGNQFPSKLRVAVLLECRRGTSYRWEISDVLVVIYNAVRIRAIENDWSCQIDHVIAQSVALDQRELIMIITDDDYCCIDLNFRSNIYSWSHVISWCASILSIYYNHWPSMTSSICCPGRTKMQAKYITSIY